jgi:hypothetical protein
MRVATSIYALEAALGPDLFNEVSTQYELDTGKVLVGDKLGWHWVLAELDVPVPRSTALMVKSDPHQHLAIGLSRGKYELRLNAKPEIGRVWLSKVLPGSIVPKEVGLALQKRAAPAVGGRWQGLTVEVYMPMHQKHPGLAEHAIIGGVKTESGDIVCFVSDRPDPISATVWHVYKMHPDLRIAQAMLSVVDKSGQRDYRSTLVGQDLSLRDFAGVKLSDDEIRTALNGIKKYVWKTDATAAAPGIPQNARKFKLGEELCSHEAKSMPVGAFLEALDFMTKK